MRQQAQVQALGVRRTPREGGCQEYHGYPKNDANDDIQRPSGVEVVFGYASLLRNVVLRSRVRHTVTEVDDQSRDGNQTEILRDQNAGEYKHANEPDTALKQAHQHQQDRTTQNSRS